MEEKVVCKEFIKIKPFASLIIGDATYFGDKKAEKGLVMREEKIPHSGGRTAGIYFTQVALEDGGISVTMNNAIIYSAAADAQEIVDLHAQGQWCPDLCKNKKDLGCDSASFDIITDKGDITMNTGADGFFGTAFHYKDNKVILADFSVDNDVMSYKAFKENVLAMFEIKKTRAKKDPTVTKN